MTGPAPKLELRDGETIRAYLEEVARLQSPVQLWLQGTLAAPFETTLQKVSPITFSTTTTPRMEPGQVLDVTFMLEARRFLLHGKVVTPGVFRIPPCIAQGERRGGFRGPFDRDPAQVLAVERAEGTVLGGHTLQGRLLDLSVQGLRVALEDLGSLGSAEPSLRVGERFQGICISGLPLTPAILCQGRVAHLTPATPEPYAGFLLEGLSERDCKHIERLLIPRLPTTFGEAFPARKRKTDFADQLGTPTLTQVWNKPPELVDQALAAAAPVQAAAGRPPASAVMRLRRAGKKLLFLSANPATAALAEAFRQDGFRQVYEAQTYQQAKLVAEQARVDLLLADSRMGGHWTKDILRTLASHSLLEGTPVILLTEHRSDAVSGQAQELAAIHVHERSRSADELLGVVCRLLFEENPVSS